MIKRLLTLLSMVLLVFSLFVNSSAVFADGENEDSYIGSVNSNARVMTDEEVSLDTESLVDLLISRDYSMLNDDGHTIEECGGA